MALIMGVIKGKNGIYSARQKVPKGLEERVAQVVGSDRPKLSWLKRSLGTRDWREANIAAKPILSQSLLTASLTDSSRNPWRRSNMSCLWRKQRWRVAT